jgi:hypothetical protein
MNSFTRHLTLFLAALTLLTFTSSSHAGNEFEFWPGADYDPGIPGFEEVLGYAPGERITWNADVIRYFEALAAAAPDRIALHRYAKSWEGRDLVYLILSAPENMRRIDEIRNNMQRLADPRKTSRSEAETIIRDQPAVTWLSYGVHGNEISSSESAMLTA